MDPAQILSVGASGAASSTAEEAHELSPREVLALVFLPGFTTKDEATDSTGRGVGMDVVKTNIAKLGGVVDITSEVGIGTKMTITLPITLAIISVLVVEVGGPTVRRPARQRRGGDRARRAPGANGRGARGADHARGVSADLSHCHLFRIPPRERPHVRSFVVIAEVGDRRLGFVVDELVGQQDIVIKALGKSLKSVRGFAGATELGDQRVALVIDAAALIDEVLPPARRGSWRWLALIT